MSWHRKHRGFSRQGYHHGNLKEALIAAARELIAARGLGVSFAEVARAAGVSPAAPYRHFADREALIAEIARRGFAAFETALAEAWDGGAPDPLAAFVRVGRAYLAFARREPAAYAAMFGEETGAPSPELEAAGARAFAVLVRGAEALCARVPGPRRPPVTMVALHVWALAHGIAALFAKEGTVRRARLPMPPEDLLEAGVRVYLDGLGV